jgi:hypothetical protein
MPGTQPVAVTGQQLPEQFSIDGIVLGAAGGEGVAVAFGGGGIDGVEHDELVRYQGVNERPTGLFQTDADGLTAEAAAELGNPSRQRFWAVLQCRAFESG